MHYKRILFISFFLICLTAQVFAADNPAKWEKIHKTNVGTIYLDTANVEVFDDGKSDKTIVFVTKEDFHNPYFVAALQRQAGLAEFEYILCYYMIDVPQNMYKIKYVDYLDGRNTIIASPKKSFEPDAYIDSWYPIEKNEIVQKLYKKLNK